MSRWWRDLWAFAAALALALAVVLRWRRGQVVMVSGAAAPAIRLLALVIVFVQGCADRLRGREEPGGQGAQAGPNGQVPGDTAQETGANGQVSGGVSQQTGPGGQVPEDTAAQAGGDGLGPAPADAFPLASEAELTTHFRLLADRGWDASAYKAMTRRLATVAEGAGAQDPGWDELLRLIEGIRGELAGPAGEAFVGRWRAHVEARRQGKAEGAAALLGLLDAAEALPVYDAWLAGYVWRQSAGQAATGAQRAELLARIERHLRVQHALLKGQVETGPVEFTAWRSKAAPPRGWSGLVVPPGLLAAAREAYPGCDAGTWATAGTLALTVVRGDGLTLVRRGQRVALAPGQAVVLRRLDLLEARGPALVRHVTLGDMSLGAGAIVTAWDIGERLDAGGRALVQAKIAAALAGDADALRGLEAVLPAAHAEIRRAVARRADAPGAAGLRMALALFDE